LSLGATLDDWSHFDLVLGLSSNLLPCVPASPDVKVAEGSALAGKVGKLPSMFNSRDEAHGLLAWNSREIYPSEVSQWSADRRLNVCLRLGPGSGCYVFDIDEDDPAKAEEIVQLIESRLGVKLPRRGRNNSGKCSLLFRLDT
jgi:hypothetical protein